MKQLSMDDFLIEKKRSCTLDEMSVDELFHHKINYVKEDIEPVPVTMKNLKLKVGMWIRLFNGSIYQIKEINIPSKVFAGVKKRKKIDGTFYYERIFKEERCVAVNYFNQSIGKEVKESIYESDIELSSFFMMDCIFKNDVLYTKEGSVIVYHKHKFKKTYVLYCIRGTSRILIKENDIVGFCNEVRRGNIIRTLSVNDKVKDRFHGWGTVIKVLPHKIYVKSPYFERMYILSESQIVDYRYYEEGI